MRLWMGFALIAALPACLFGPPPPDGVREGFADFVVTPNAERAGNPKLLEQRYWDEQVYQRVLGVVQELRQDPSFHQRLDEIVDDYAWVTEAMREAGLPEVLAAIPYRESRYAPLGMKSPHCEAGPWQFTPEAAFRARRDLDATFEVRDCVVKVEDSKRTSGSAVRPHGNRWGGACPPMETVDCRFTSCGTDDRLDIAKSTAAAILALSEPWNDERLSSSGAIVELTILSHLAGYHDRRFGQMRTTNILPTYLQWKRHDDPQQTGHFYSDNIRCAGEYFPGSGLRRCGARLTHETQEFGYMVIGLHLAAVCHYATNHADRPAFAPWVKYTRPGGYCTAQWTEPLIKPLSMTFRARRQPI